MRQYAPLSDRWQVWLTSRATRPRAWAEDHTLIIAVGLATCFFGFLAGALANMYLIATHHPLVFQFRTTLSYRSAVFGDGLVLPLVNMAAASFLARERHHVRRLHVVVAGLIGMTITAYFHIVQAENQLVNWSMPAPWQWNALGAWHAGYMLAVTSLLALFLLVLVTVARADTTRRGPTSPATAMAVLPLEVAIVTLGLLAFLVLLHLDYRASVLEWVSPLR